MPSTIGIPGSHNINALWTWGTAANGRLGNNTTTPDVSTPAQINTNTDWEVLSSTSSFSVGIRNGKLFTWGSNANGQTGQNTTSGNTLTPTQIGTDSDWKAAAGGTASGFAIRNGQLYSWGNNANYRTAQGTNTGTTNTPTQVGTDSDWAFVFGGWSGAYAIKTNGKLYAWGLNGDFLTVQGTETGETAAPTQVGTDSDWSFAMSGIETTNVATAVGIKGGRPVSWGDNASGATAQGTGTGNTSTPTALSGFSSATDWTSIAIGSSSGGGIGGGKLYTWGSNAGFRTGRNVSTGSALSPVQVGSLTDWAQNVQSNQSGLALRANRIYSWGSNANGRTGQGTTTGTTNTPVQIGTDTDWKSIGHLPINAAHVAAIKG